MNTVKALSKINKVSSNLGLDLSILEILVLSEAYRVVIKADRLFVSFEKIADMLEIDTSEVASIAKDLSAKNVFYAITRNGVTASMMETKICQKMFFAI